MTLACKGGDKPRNYTMPNNKAPMPNKAQRTKGKGLNLAFKHMDLNCHLDFDIGNFEI